MATPDILILDDDSHFRESLKRALESKGFKVKASAATPSIMRSLVKRPPSEIVMDVSLRGRPIEKSLEWLKEQGMAMDDCRIWLVSGEKTAPASELNRDYKCVQTTWFGKPVAVEALLGQLYYKPERSPDSDSLNAYLNALPYPLRVIGTSGRVVYTNVRWKAAADRPDPSTNQIEYLGPLPDDPQVFGRFRIRTFSLPKSFSLLIRDHAPGDAFLAQVVETLPEAQPETLEALFDQAFHTLKDAGFSRARFYRIIPVPGCPGISELWKALGPGHENLAVPIRYPLGGQCAERLNASSQTTKPEPHKLVYTLRYCDDELEQKDSGLKFWNEKVLAPGQKSWVDIPILRKTAARQYRSVGLLCLDRMGSTRLADAVPEEVNEDLIKRIEGTLRQTFNQAIRIMERKESANELRLAKLANRWDRYLGQKAIYRRDIEARLLKLAKRLTHADIGLLVVRDGGTNELLVQSVRGIPSKYEGEIRFPLRAERFLLVRSWNTGQAQYAPDIEKLPEDQILNRGDCVLVCPKYSAEFYWHVEQNRRSAIAIPIHYGQRVIGVIALKSRNPYHFNGARVQILQALLHRARWYMHIALEEETREMWGYSMMHEIRTDIHVFRQAILALERAATEPASAFYQNALKRAKRHGLSLADSSDDFMDVLAKDLLPQKTTISDSSPNNVIEEFLALYEEKLAWDHQTIRRFPEEGQDPVWQVILSDDRYVFPRVLRNLLHNALRYGGERATIRVKASHEDSFWCVELWNPGHMTKEEDRLKFIPFAKSTSLKPHGLHVGLAASLKLVQASGGDLDLDNDTDADGNSWVVARLRWPLKRQEKLRP